MIDEQIHIYIIHTYTHMKDCNKGTNDCIGEGDDLLLVLIHWRTLSRYIRIINTVLHSACELYKISI